MSNNNLIIEQKFTEKSILKINFCSFWPNFDPKDNYFYHLLSRDYRVEISNKPDFLIYSKFGFDFLKYNCIRIFYTAENARPNFNQCDFAFSFDHDDSGNRNYRLPFYAIMTSALEKLLGPKPDYQEIISQKSGFCNMVVSNGNALERIEFFHKLSRYKKVDSGGRYLNNIGGPVKDKQAFVRKYKFTIAFENDSYPGYTTEKIFHAMLCHSIPIYWGNPRIAEDFNPESFINIHDFQNFEDAIEYVKKVDQDELLYRKYLEASYFKNNQLNPCFDRINVLNKFKEIIESKGRIQPIAKTLRGHYGTLQRFKERYSWLLKSYLKKSYTGYLPRNSNIALFQKKKISYKPDRAKV